MANFKKTDGTQTIKGADGKIVTNVPAGKQAAVSAPPLVAPGFDRGPRDAAVKLNAKYETLRRRRGHRFYPTMAELKNMPTMDELDAGLGVDLNDVPVRVHYFGGTYDAYIVAIDADMYAWGYVRFSHMPENAEWGVVSLAEMESLSVRNTIIERDLGWVPKNMNEINKKKGIQDLTVKNVDTAELVRQGDALAAQIKEKNSPLWGLVEMLSEFEVVKRNENSNDVSFRNIDVDFLVEQRAILVDLLTRESVSFDSRLWGLVEMLDVVDS
jgi:hypothetical protein